MNIEDVKPLFGIREHLEGYSSEIGAYQKEIDELRKKMEDLQNASSFKPPVCSQCLCDNSVSFWCKECEKEMCDDCLETHHDKHSVVAIKKHLRREVEKKLSKVSLKENYTKTGEHYEKLSLRGHKFFKLKKLIFASALHFSEPWLLIGMFARVFPKLRSISVDIKMNH